MRAKARDADMSCALGTILFYFISLLNNHLEANYYYDELTMKSGTKESESTMMVTVGIGNQGDNKDWGSRCRCVSSPRYIFFSFVYIILLILFTLTIYTMAATTNTTSPCNYNN